MSRCSQIIAILFLFPLLAFAQMAEHPFDYDLHLFSLPGTNQRTKDISMHLSQKMDPIGLGTLQEQKTIGVIGGASWESTQLYYQLINKAVREQLGGLNSAKLLIHSINYAPIVRLEQQEKWDEVGKQIADVAKMLEEG